MEDQTAAILIRAPRKIGAKLPLLERLQRCGRRFELFFIGFGPEQLTEAEQAQVTRLNEQGVALYMHTGHHGSESGFCRIDKQEMANRLNRAKMVIPL